MTYSLDQASQIQPALEASASFAGTAKEFLLVATASGFGTFVAFWFQWKREDRRSRETACNTGRVALLRLLDRYEWLMNFNRQGLTPIEGSDPELWDSYPILHMPYRPEPLDTAPLAFLISPEDPDLLTSLLAGESLFRSVTATLDLRNGDFHEYQARCARLARAGAQYTSQHEKELAVGLDLCSQLKQLTKQMRDRAARAIGETRTDFSRLRSALKRAYPKERFQDVTNWDKQSTSQPA